MALLEILLELPLERRTDALSSSSVPADVRVLVERLLAAHARDTGPLERPLQPGISATYASKALKGRRFGRWQLQYEIGQGGMAVVYRAISREAPLGQEAAIKVLTLGALARGGRERFLRERQLLARLQHPYIIPLYDAGVADDGTPWLAMALVDGERIDDWCDKQALSVEGRIELIRQVAEALEYAHHKLVIHRDIKPSNVLVDAHGHVRLLDFGIAKLNDELELEQTATALRALTPEYAAPEQFTGAAPSTTMDVYGLGALLYRLVSGQSPRHRDKSGEDARTWAPSRVVQEDARRPQGERRQIVRQLQGDLDTIVMKALAQEPERRYASIEAMAEDLRRWRDREPIAAHPPSTWYRTRKFVARNRLGVSAAALVLIVAGAAFAATLWQARIAQYQAKRANAVRDFLVELLDTSKAALPHDQKPTPQLLVHQASQRLHKDATVDPALRVDLLRTLGQVSLSLGDYAQAESLLDEAIASGQKLGLPSSSPEWLESKVYKGVLLKDTNRNDEADKWFASLLPEMRTQDSKPAVDGMMTYCEVRMYAGKSDEAVALMNEAVAKARRIYPRDSLDEVQAASMPGQLSAALRRYPESVAQLEPVVARWRELKLPRDLDFAWALNNLAVSKEKTGEIAGAEKLYREGIALRRDIFYGGESPAVAQAIGNFAIFLIKQEKFDEAHALLTEALATNRKMLGDEHHEVADTLDILGTLEWTRLRPKEAERYLRESERIYSAHIDSSNRHVDLALVRGHLARVLVDMGKNDEARPLLEWAIATYREKLGERNELVGAQAHGLAKIALSENDPRTALSLLDQSLSILNDGKAPSRAKAENHYLRADALGMLGRNGDALKEIAEAIVQIKTVSPVSYARQTRMLALQARLQKADGNTKAAAATIAQALALRAPVELLPAEDAVTLGLAPASSRQ